MRKKGISLLIPVFFLCFLALIFGMLRYQLTELSLVQFRDERSGLSLSPYYDETDDKYYLFLPASQSQDALSISLPWYADVTFTVDGTEYDTIGSLPLDQEGTLSIVFPWGSRTDYTFQLLKCSAERTICLETSDGTMEYLNEDKSRKRDVSVRILTDSGDLEYQGLGTLSGRGNATWGWPKKPYNLDFPQAVTVGEFVDVEKLCIFSEFTDTSKLRNSLAFRLGELLEIPYSSPYMYADVFIDGEYYGLCGLAVKSEYEKHLGTDDIQAVFELTSSVNGIQFGTDLQNQIRVIYGNAVDIQYIIECFETALAAEDWDQVYQYIDLESIARKYAMDEFLFNTDLGWASQYFYMDSRNVIHSMLPWDYEWTLSSSYSDYEPGRQTELAAYFDPESWFCRLLESDAFIEAVSVSLQKDFTEELFDELSRYLNETCAMLGDSWRCDRVRWINDLYDYYRYQMDKSFLLRDRDEFIEYLPHRKAFLTDYFRDPSQFVRITFQYQFEGSDKTAMFMLVVPVGADFTVYHQGILDSTETYRGENFQGWFTEDGTPLSELTSVTEDMTLYGIFHSPMLA